MNRNSNKYTRFIKKYGDRLETIKKNHRIIKEIEKTLEDPRQIADYLCHHDLFIEFDKDRTAVELIELFQADILKKYQKSNPYTVPN